MARSSSISRKTKETEIQGRLVLDGTGIHTISTGRHFLDHMLSQLSAHSLMDLTLTARGDLHIDAHHTTEDSAIALGQAFGRALQGGRGVRRFCAAYAPMDEALTRVAVDISGRPFLVWRVSFERPAVGDMDTELFKEWFRGFAQAGGITLHVENLYGENTHHIIESCFKALGLALRGALERDPRRGKNTPSTKGVLEIPSQ